MTTDETLPAERAAPDWMRIEVDYRAGLKTVRAIAAEHGLTHARVVQRAKAEGWERSLSHKIAKSAEREVQRREAELTKRGKALTKSLGKGMRLTEKEVVTAGAAAIADVQTGQRKDVRRLRAIFTSALTDLEVVAGQPDLMAEVAAALKSADMDALARAAARAVGMDSRLDQIAKATATLRSLQEAEDRAFRIKDEAPAPAPYSNLSDDELQLMIRTKAAKLGLIVGQQS